ncbi:T9SS type A sorting domain-containing protein [bacterium SCSIO 12741]|nr:T9SS type A sorting domain-containing protein [bacterium SCSIO 12741]
MKIRIPFFLALLFMMMNEAQAQVPKTVMVEHFTNTRCGICGSRNPSFINYISSRSDILHMSVHPSRPYNTCFLNNHNPSENDSRTQFYSGVFGSTPRIVVGGSVIAANVNYASMNTYSPYTGQTSPISIAIDPIGYEQSTEMLKFRVVLHTEASHSLGNLSLLLAVTEDTVFFAAPNGENRHYNVFRQSATDVMGDPVTAATMVGDSMVYTYSLKYNSDWDFDRINATVIVQETASKEVVQAARQTKMNQMNQGPNSIEEMGTMHSLSIFPNPLRGSIIQFQNATQITSLQLFDLNGNQVAQREGHTEQWVLENLNPGAYILRVNDEQHGTQTQLLIKQ